jgi:hypothetical protein
MALSPGFQFTEAQTLLTIAQQTYDGTPGMPTSTTQCIPPVPDPPSNWVLDTDLTPTEATVLDNFWQVWQNTDQPNQYAIAVRGTVETSPSILEDLLLPLIQAHASLSFEACGIDFDLSLALAQDEGDSAVVAGVHAGFTLGLLSMLFTTDQPLWLTLYQLSDSGAEVYLTGHSQGASVATLLTSFVRHSSRFTGASWKTYVFAPAKPGNDHYAYDFAQIAGLPGMGFSVTSTQDWVPEAPLTLQGLAAVNTPNPVRKFPSTSAASPGPSTVAATAAADTQQQEAVQRFESLLAELDQRLATATYKVSAGHLGGSSSACSRS